MNLLWFEQNSSDISSLDDRVGRLAKHFDGIVVSTTLGNPGIYQSIDVNVGVPIYAGVKPRLAGCAFDGNALWSSVKRFMEHIPWRIDKSFFVLECEQALQEYFSTEPNESEFEALAKMVSDATSLTPLVAWYPSLAKMNVPQPYIALAKTMDRVCGRSVCLVDSTHGFRDLADSDKAKGWRKELRKAEQSLTPLYYVNPSGGKYWTYEEWAKRTNYPQGLHQVNLTYPGVANLDSFADWLDASIKPKTGGRLPQRGKENTDAT